MYTVAIPVGGGGGGCRGHGGGGGGKNAHGRITFVLAVALAEICNNHIYSYVELNQPSSTNL